MKKEDKYCTTNRMKRQVNSMRVWKTLQPAMLEPIVLRTPTFQTEVLDIQFLSADPDILFLLQRIK